MLCGGYRLSRRVVCTSEPARGLDLAVTDRLAQMKAIAVYCSGRPLERLGGPHQTQPNSVYVLMGVAAALVGSGI